MNHKIVCLAGPTASGKSALALKIAEKFDIIIINADSKQVYKEIPIITAQPTEEEKKAVPHDLYSTISASVNCSVAMWIEMAVKSIDNAISQGKIPMLVGGTGMYFKSLIDGIPEIPDIEADIRLKVRKLYAEEGSCAIHQKLSELDNDMAERLNKGDSHRVMRAYEVILQTGKSLAYWQKQKPVTHYKKDNFLQFFLSPPRETVYNNCNTRFEKMIQAGVIEEVQALSNMNLDKTLPAMKAHGVLEIIAYLNNEMSLNDAVSQAQRNTRHYIKRQFTWFSHQMDGIMPIYDDAAGEIMRFLG